MITEIEIALATEKEMYQKFLNHTQNDNHLKRRQMLAGNEHTLGCVIIELTNRENSAKYMGAGG